MTDRNAEAHAEALAHLHAAIDALGTLAGKQHADEARRIAEARLEWVYDDEAREPLERIVSSAARIADET